MNNSAAAEEQDDDDEDMVSTQKGTNPQDKPDEAEEIEPVKKGESNDNSNKDDGNGDSSTDSTSEAKSGSGSGGGYSADCSASDQSSDEDGKRKANAVGDASTGLEQLEIKDEEEDDKPSADEESERTSPATNNVAADDPNGGGGQATAVSTSKGQTKKHHHHHHHYHHKSSTAVARSSRTNNGENGGEEGGETDIKAGDEQGEGDNDSIGLPLKSPDVIDIDAILKAKSREEEENANFLASAPFLPQWNGVRVGNPMDPRIDLSSVSVLPSSFLTAGTTAAATPYLTMTGAPVLAAQASYPRTPALNVSQGVQQNQHQPQQHGQQQHFPEFPGQSNLTSVPSIYSYLQLMEMVRPFFLSHGVPFMGPTQPQQHRQAQQDPQQAQNDSSEGFTSFFTTTHSSQQSGSSSGEGGQRTQQIPHQEVDAEMGTSAPTAAAAAAPLEGDQAEDENETNKSDSSSMVVLARVKRKHQKGKAGERLAPEGERRVRIQEKAKGELIYNREMEELSHQKPHPLPPQDADEVVPAPPDADAESPECSASSASGPRAAGAAHAALHHLRLHNPVPPRIVTDVSSSNRTDTSGPSQTSSGSAGNTGSGSNNTTTGSSGSGNETKGSSEEGGCKGSSEEGGGKGGSGGGSSEEQKEGESPMEGSEELSDSKMNGVETAATKTVEHHHHHHHHHPYYDPTGGTSPGLEGENNSQFDRERKLMDKKRKRIEMRREYEAQQHMESSESSGRKNEVLFRPGKPVTFDQVLQFSTIARLVTQASPPFLVVHANAAFTRLTGVDSHNVVGRPIRSILSLPDQNEATNPPPADNAGEDMSSASGNPQASDDAPAAPERAAESFRLPAEPAGRWGRPAPPHHRRPVSKQDSLDRMVAASGFGRLHMVQVVSKHSQIVGKSVAFLKEASAPAPMAARAEVLGPMVANAPEAAPDGQLNNMHNDQSLSSETGTVPHHEQWQKPITRRISCRASIAPIVSEQTVPQDDESAMDIKRRKIQPSSDCQGRKFPGKAEHEEQDAKRRKLVPPGETPGCPVRGGKRQLITHYVVQLEGVGDKQSDSVDSLSSNSTSVEARLLGVSKQEARHQRGVTTGADNVESTTVGGEDNGAGSESTPSTKEPLAAVG